MTKIETVVATPTLRWNGDVLEQLYHITTPDKKGRFEWRVVPRKDDYAWGEED